MRISARLLARPWPERPVSEANKSGKHTIAAQAASIRSRWLKAQAGGDN